LEIKNVVSRKSRQNAQKSYDRSIEFYVAFDLLPTAK